MMEAYEDAMNSKKVYHSVEELFKDLDSDDQKNVRHQKIIKIQN